MANTRLKLDFSITDSSDRVEFIRSYLDNNIFKEKPLTASEVEIISNYILWGKDPDGKNAVQRKEIHIPTKNSAWNRLQEEESLDALIEAPAFNENTIMRPSEARAKNTKETFSREQALQKCPPNLVNDFRDLFRQIDETELVLNYYDLEHGKRKKPPRDELLSRFTEQEHEKMRARALRLNQYFYLKMRHLLIELRRQQYTLKDTYSYGLQRDILCKGQTDNLPPDPPRFGTEIEVFPFGMVGQQRIEQLVFRPFAELVPKNFDEEELRLVSSFLWEKKDNQSKEETHFCFDFTNLEHVYNLFLMYFDVEEASLLEDVDKSAARLLDTLVYYMDAAELSPVQREILNLKANGFKNQEIADRVNEQFGYSYGANYISTIFRQKIIKGINEAAEYHRQLLENVFFPEEFKRCICCGETLLRDSKNFVRKSRAKDGFVNKCKRCDKRDRELKKERQKFEKEKKNGETERNR